MPRRASSQSHPHGRAAKDPRRYVSDVQPGSFLWLPAKDQLDEELLRGSVLASENEGLFNHPVMVLTTKPAKKMAVILLVTSFGGTDLEERHKDGSRARSEHLPVFPSPAHPDTGTQLYLDGYAQLERQSYVKTAKSFDVPWGLLRSYSLYRSYKLSLKSLDDVLTHMGMRTTTTINNQPSQGFTRTAAQPRRPLSPSSMSGYYHPDTLPQPTVTDALRNARLSRYLYEAVTYQDSLSALRSSSSLPPTRPPRSLISTHSPKKQPLLPYSTERTHLLAPTYAHCASTRLTQGVEPRFSSVQAFIELLLCLAILLAFGYGLYWILS